MTVECFYCRERTTVVFSPLVNICNIRVQYNTVLDIYYCISLLFANVMVNSSIISLQL